MRGFHKHLMTDECQLRVAAKARSQDHSFQQKQTADYAKTSDASFNGPAQQCLQSISGYTREVFEVYAITRVGSLCVFYFLFLSLPVFLAYKCFLNEDKSLQLRNR